MQKFLAAWAFVLWAAVAHAQFQVTASTGSSVATRTGSKLQLTTMHGLYGQAAAAYKAAGITNATNLNTYFSNTDTSTAWWKDRLPLELPHRYPISSTVSIGTRLGETVNFTSGGYDDGRYEAEYHTSGAGYRGGKVAGFVWANRDSVTGPMIRSSVGSGSTGRMTLQGLYSLVDRNTLLSSGEKNNRVDVGWEQTGQIDGVGLGAGKVDFDLFGAVLCKTALKVVPGTGAFATSNGDECTVNRFTTRYCDTGFWCDQHDAMLWTFNVATQMDTSVMFLFEQAGRLHVRDLRCQDDTNEAVYPSDVGLKITGNDGDNTVPPYLLDNVDVDETTDADYLLVQVAPTSGYSNAEIIIGNLRCPIDRTTGALISLVNCYGGVTIKSGQSLYAGIIHVEGGATGSPGLVPFVIVECASFEPGADMDNIRNLFDTSSRGVVDVVFRANREQSGASQANAGALYNTFVGRIDILTNTTLSVLSGGYVKSETYQSTPP